MDKFKQDSWRGIKTNLVIDESLCSKSPPPAFWGWRIMSLSKWNPLLRTSGIFVPVQFFGFPHKCQPWHLKCSKFNVGVMMKRLSWIQRSTVFLVMVSLAVTIALGTWGCATMVTGTEQNVLITSNPTGALVKINEKTYQTPATLKLGKKSNHFVVIEKPGYESEAVEIRRHISWWNTLDVLWVYLAPIPLMYDLKTGGFYELEKTIHVELKPNSAETLFRSTPVSKEGSPTELNPWPLDFRVIPVVMPVPVTPRPHRIALVGHPQDFGHPFRAWLDVALNFLRKRHPSMMIIERETNAFITSETTSQLSGRFDDESTVRIGKLVGADTLLTYQMQPMNKDMIETYGGQGGEISGQVELRLVHVESGVTTFRQAVVATTILPAPEKENSWPKDLIHLIHRKILKKATSYALSALVAAFGDNPLGVVPSLDTPGEGVMVEGVLQGGPADKKDLQKGDRILSLNGEPLADWTTRISLPAELTIQRNGKKQQLILGKE